jgi:hypothetical protein
LICKAEVKDDAVPMNSERTRGDLFDLSWQRINSIEVVFIPSRKEVIRAKSAAESNPKYSSRSMAWWLQVMIDVSENLAEPDLMENSNSLVMNRSIVKGTISTVDVADELGDLCLQVGLLRQGRGGHLNEDNLAPPLGVDLQELLERLELVVYTLGDVELFSSDNNLLALVERTKGLGLGVDSRSVTVRHHRHHLISIPAANEIKAGPDSPVRGDPVDVDPDRAISDRSDLSVGVNPAGSRLVTADPDTGRSKVSRVRIGLEADEVGTEHTFEDLLALCSG